ncbi:MAG: serine--tRNA ligase, partial [Deltaproteobacteria bacterium]|nr:serine--tRNA ligase [Deltaproteobacteria bacterium]
MLDLKFVRENCDLVTEMMANRQMDMDLTPFLELDEKRRAILREAEELKHRRNVATDEISRLKREKKDAAGLIEEMRSVSQRIRELDQGLEIIEQSFKEILLLIPNVPHHSVVVGTS